LNPRRAVLLGVAEARRERTLANAKRTRELAERAQAKLAERSSG
jgi:hypothetical protein